MVRAGLCPFRKSKPSTIHANTTANTEDTDKGKLQLELAVMKLKYEKGIIENELASSRAALAAVQAHASDDDDDDDDNDDDAPCQDSIDGAELLKVQADLVQTGAELESVRAKLIVANAKVGALQKASDQFQKDLESSEKKLTDVQKECARLVKDKSTSRKAFRDDERSAEENDLLRKHLKEARLDLEKVQRQHRDMSDRPESTKPSFSSPNSRHSKMLEPPGTSRNVTSVTGVELEEIPNNVARRRGLDEWAQRSTYSLLADDKYNLDYQDEPDVSPDFLGSARKRPAQELHEQQHPLSIMITKDSSLQERLNEVIIATLMKESKLPNTTSHHDIPPTCSLKSTKHAKSALTTNHSETTENNDELLLADFSDCALISNDIDDDERMNDTKTVTTNATATPGSVEVKELRADLLASEARISKQVSSLTQMILEVTPVKRRTPLEPT